MLLPEVLRAFHIAGLTPLVPTDQQDDQRVSVQPEVHAVPWPTMNAQLLHTATDALAVAEVAELEPRQARTNARSRLPIAKTFQPL